MHQNYDLDYTLMRFDKEQPSSDWRIRNAVEGVQIFGGIGSGKTSGSGRALALKYLNNGFGGLVLTVKPDEKAMWEDYCRLTGRTKDLVVIGPGRAERFNFLEYESTANKDASFTQNIVQVLKTVIRASAEKNTGKSDDPFWETALDMLMFNLIDLCQLAYGRTDINLLYDMAQTVPKKQLPVSPNKEGSHRPDEMTDKGKAFGKAYRAAARKVVEQVEQLQKDTAASHYGEITPELMDELIMERLPDARRLRYIEQFFSDTFRNLSEKTRSILDFSFSGFLFQLLQEPVYGLFCNKSSTVVPEDCFKTGKIILVNLPVKTYHKIGRDSQIMFKYIWQRAMEKRNVNQYPRPVFLWADEAQNFLHEYDSEYQATARSSKIATVYISQNLPNYYANMGGDKSEYRVKSFMGTLATKIFHANSDVETNSYAASLIGEAYIKDVGGSSTMAGKEFTSGNSWNYRLEQMVRPDEFIRLKSGGDLNHYKVYGYIIVQGKEFSNGFHYKKISFDQNAQP